MRIYVLLSILIGVVLCFVVNLRHPFYKFVIYDKPNPKVERRWDGAQKEILRFCKEQPFLDQTYQELTNEEYAIYAVTVEKFFKNYNGGKPQIYRRNVNPICQGDA